MLMESFYCMYTYFLPHTSACLDEVTFYISLTVLLQSAATCINKNFGFWFWFWMLPNSFKWYRSKEKKLPCVGNMLHIAINPSPLYEAVKRAKLYLSRPIIGRDTLFAYIIHSTVHLHGNTSKPTSSIIALGRCILARLMVERMMNTMVLVLWRHLAYMKPFDRL